MMNISFVNKDTVKVESNNVTITLTKVNGQYTGALGDTLAAIMPQIAIKEAQVNNGHETS
jgi:hypothetical protein